MIPFSGVLQDDDTGCVGHGAYHGTNAMGVGAKAFVAHDSRFVTELFEHGVFLRVARWHL